MKNKEHKSQTIEIDKKATEPDHLWPWSYISPIASLASIGTLLTDTLKPYQNKNQFIQDLFQPFIGITHLVFGFVKTLTGIFTCNGWHFLDGLATMTRGLVELITTPLAWLIKPITRGIATLLKSQSVDANWRRRHQEFSTFTTNNPHCFAEGTYFLVSMQLARGLGSEEDDSIDLYPGTGMEFREGANVPDEFRHPDKPKKIHPDLDIQIRRKAHRVFHEQILGHNISIFQTLMANESSIFFDTRGAGAFLRDGQLEADYKSGVLNGKWSLQFFDKQLGYGELMEPDKRRLEKALLKLTEKASRDSSPDGHAKP